MPKDHAVRESVVAKAKRLAAERRQEEARLKRLRAPDIGAVANEVIAALISSLRSKSEEVGTAAELQSSVEGQNPLWVVHLGTISTTVRWDNPYHNSLTDAKLSVMAWGFHYVLPHGGRMMRADPANETRYELDLLDEQWVWREDGDGEPLPSEELAETIFHDLVDRAFSPPPQNQHFSF
ncbi:hypothetical protein [Longimicrobium terrae]|uniref:Uncharacterized protein n=1 Tax=Longimicrobium terrae TaxID=1639882 RepID=A0A841GXB7_9BACT|nr:hypothetical protein [Longimicrobium terrae]MBB4635462.1 hypothetical protein [Longimicrobium terrae]MBB6069856.1 hypothetical protein [Longimicrobium terrae]NNC30940.1 hypothetical protein [Longimicrobium terrae]NNC32774.1 hypothetical protein [Longimicrobium terrae]